MTRCVLIGLALVALGGGMGAASSPAAGRTAAPRSEVPMSVQTPQRVQAALPTLHLLRTVRVLADLTARGTLTLDAPARAALRAEAQALAAAPTLGASAAGQSRERLLAALTTSQRTQLARAEADLARRAELLAARARFAAPDGPVNRTALLYSFQVPGGLGTVQVLLAQSALNPYRTPGPNAAVLERLHMSLTP
ncbi:hypothetical protein F8S09_04730 [Deinococcus sp. SDU3-2]|uniref:DUF4142 domain-containing protein n=1 Tax=Deinococcus terrestris TaxID=2651870 RepID=A0A7X1NUF0_9DEIO|nr:hypothetical protein [Deinococcus terrestris]MPY66002.1 hypothetical protein [Deinococcus terrestris]